MITSMLLSNWEKLLPEQVTQYMTFVKDDTDWSYSSSETTSMAAKQAEGVAYLARLLANKRLALLADEVGMGKTFQAIGLIHLLQLQNSKAKTLIIAPNRNICHQWKGEFNSFFLHHRKPLDRAQAEVSDVYGSLPELVEGVKQSEHHVYLTTIHALSGLTREEDILDKTAEASKRAEGLRQQVFGAIGNDGFDLMVIDEAHYLRTRNGGSQKVEAAKAFFGQDSTPLAKSTLLMTATPTHSSSNDVWNILRYFTSESSLNKGNTDTRADAASLLKKFALRRLRLMHGAGGRYYSKHDYRYESVLPVSFEDNPNAELFFGLYQRQLVKDLRKKGSNRQFLYGYLEGFESFGHSDDKLSVENSDTYDNEKNSEHYAEPSIEINKDAFSKAPDSQLLYELSQEYFECFDAQPEHPKYNALVAQFVPKSLTAERLDRIKHLVFVRRIPSVRELTKRVNTDYDDCFGKMISQALNFSDVQVTEWRSTHWSRVWLNRQLGGQAHENESMDDHDDEDITVDSDYDETQIRSRITELFVVKKKGLGSIDETRNTRCTNVGLRFKKPESIYSLFLEPARDYVSQDYDYYFEHRTENRVRALYATAAISSRYESNGLSTHSVEDDKHYGVNLPTIWKYLIDMLPSALLEHYMGWTAETKENFANYFKAGVLFASPVMVELFCWFVEHERQYKGQESTERAYSQYLNFVEHVTGKLEQSWLFWYFKAAIETFEDVCEKVARVQVSDHQYEWRTLKSLTSPAAFASGETSNRDALQTGFNSPFYPNVLVATSVFQEGVNLHLHCNQVHHYGIAGNPGDHEQRVGRLDRLFGKVHRQLECGEQANLTINFPYLSNSFDEDQLASFLEKKARAESKLDQCLLDNSDAHVGMDKTSNWTQYLKSPASGIERHDDPYPAIFD
ncbi:DEAD/DEAH box helicase [Vibrio breoganii]|uniref:DEAD/DEAH box helicase family protein n=2 Tax=Vibrio breoganii TaxID=553239 RepID=A0ABX1U9M0_9VIBR|nr:DEAD/DEAH box helicase [Vibrio breoganii]NMO74694.1 DEAD/DEAH box helicase family protein [Vibrio breoganii]NMR71187.1 DEAD/DEAH box helicase family protein [Vibrio breoganii]